MDTYLAKLNGRLLQVHDTHIVDVIFWRIRFFRFGRQTLGNLKCQGGFLFLRAPFWQMFIFRYIKNAMLSEDPRDVLPVGDDHPQVPFDKRWGYYLPESRYTVDQIPMQLDFQGVDYTWKPPPKSEGERKADAVPVKGGGGAGGAKRFCTVHLCFRSVVQADLPQCKPY